MAKECNNTSCDKASCEGCSSSKKQQSFQAEMNAQSNVKPTTLSQINAEDYSLIGWYDAHGSAAGGKIRVLVAVKKD